MSQEPKVSDRVSDPMARALALAHQLDLKRHKSHFATCPNADDWRRKREIRAK